MPVTGLPERLWTHQETAQFLRLPEQTLHYINHTGKGPLSHRTGRYRRYEPADVMRWVRFGIASAEHAPPGTEETDIPEQLWTHEETADFLRLSQQTLHYMNHTGNGPLSYRVGRYRRYIPAEVMQWVRADAA